jgi:hypothetical protein
MRARRARDESGAVAIIVAIASLAIFGAAALAVDLGNAEARVRATAAQADLAAIAGGGPAAADLPATLPGGNCTAGNLAGQTRTTTASDPSVLDVMNYLNKNRPQSDQGAITVTADQLSDCDTTNGEVIHGTLSSTNQVTANVNQVTVITPPAFVQFGLAGVLGFNDVNVRSTATAEIKTPMGSALPFYAFNGCDYGPQTIANPTNGQAASTVNLASGSDVGPEVLTSLSTVPGSNPLALALNDTTTQLVINGTGLTGVTNVGFFESGTTSPGPDPVVVNAADNPGGFTVNNDNKITLNAPLPTQLTSVQDTWYVRVKIGSGPWSKVSIGNGGGATLNALPISVGSPMLICNQGSSSGNFGTLKLQDTGQWQQVAVNVANGLPHTLAPYPGATAPFTCTSGVAPAVLWPSDGTNCVETETGLDSNAATAGFVQGVPSAGVTGGLLTHSLTDSRSGCNGLPAQTNLLSRTINNDTLSCFFINNSTTISQVDSSSYSLPGPAFSQNIWYSPRLVAVPVLGTQPSNGGSAKYDITGFRYGFITEQAQSATKSTGYLGNNGITLTSNNNAIQSLQLIFINSDSLPSPPQDVIKGYRDYVGSGIKNLLLVN